MSLSMRKQDWERLFADHPDALDGTLPVDAWKYDPLMVAAARLAAVIHRDLIRPIVKPLIRDTPKTWPPCPRD